MKIPQSDTDNDHETITLIFECLYNFWMAEKILEFIKAELLG